MLVKFDGDDVSMGGCAESQKPSQCQDEAHGTPSSRLARPNSIDDLIPIASSGRRQEAPIRFGRLGAAAGLSADQRELMLKQRLDATTPLDRAKLGAFLKVLVERLKELGIDLEGLLEGLL